MIHSSCPLCEHLDAVEMRTFSFSTIIRKLEQEHGCRLSPKLIRELVPCEVTKLLACRYCGLQYFSPAVAGSSEFYGELVKADPAYYNVNAWDFRCALAGISPGSSVLDVGCGAGAFLSLAQRKGLKACGIDTNSFAVAQASATGVTASVSCLESFRLAYDGYFDVVTAFQVLEHLESVLPFITQAVQCLRPGGRLLISVPNRNRLWRQDDEPLDCPPHHLSRWSKKQFQQLAKQCGLRLKAVHFEPASALDLMSPLLRSCRAIQASDAGASSPLTDNHDMFRSLFARLRYPSTFLALLGVRRLGMLAVLDIPLSR